MLTQAIDSHLNATPKGVQQSLKQANADLRIFTQEMKTSTPGGSTPTDWWVYDRGYLKIGGVYQYIAYFHLTPSGEAFAKAPVTNWLAASFPSPPKADCSGERTWSVCRITGTVSVKPTAAGAAFVQSSVPDQAIDAELTYSTQGWVVSKMAVRDALIRAGTTAVLGTPEQAAEARAKYAVTVNKLVG